ncbi:hypothetical protein FIBSPDRAFT_868993 [Athelia psychrophila]|uniref:L-type lectin-like domain-containing protein n=1 Tax=Athelia psychrophila TaxID=1759441 RepID=A0A166CJQ4_9AGAM|nr:hypothetical protein FIBSPDRAFT_868993 [Fibularhizoctonia sp. CBS 109695]
MPVLPLRNLLTSLVLLCGLLCLGVQAADSKIVNRTIERQVPLRTHSIYAPYIDQDLQNRWWDFGADAYVNTNKHIRLTRNKPSQMGWLWSRLPISAHNFVIEVEFKVSGDSSHLFGDGFALWLTKERTQPGPVFGNQDEFEGLGIFLDTYANSRHAYSFPRITSMIGDGKTKYDQGGDGDANSAGGCSANFRRSNVATKLKVTYVKGSYLNVAIHHKAWDEWTNCFTIHDITLPPTPFLGFTAMTGEVTDNHDIITINSYSAIMSQEDRPRDKFYGMRDAFSPRKGSAAGESGSWIGFMFKLGLFLGVCVAGVLGFKAYQQKTGRGGRNAYGGGGAFGGGGGYAEGIGRFTDRFTGNSKRF